MTTYKVWEGPSLIDGKPIVLLLVTESSNAKTGQMLQTHVLRADMTPWQARKTGADVSICGSCVHRKDELDDCYVIPWMGPRVAWEQWEAGKAADLPRLARHNKLRCGSYGEPVAVPFDVWKPLLDRWQHTGYTERWALPENQVWREHLHASANTEEDADRAEAMGWSVFLVTPKGKPSTRKSTPVCPASNERGHVIQCIDCMRCHGTRDGRLVSVQIQNHSRKGL